MMFFKKTFTSWHEKQKGVKTWTFCLRSLTFMVQEGSLSTVTPPLPPLKSNVSF